MIKNYLVMAYRNFLKQKVYSCINIFGLAVGLVSAIFIFLYVHDELSYDSIHPDPSNTYRLGMTYDDGKGDAGTSETVPGGWASALKERLPEVTSTFRTIFQGFPTSVKNHEDDRIFLTKDGTLFWVTPEIDEVLYYHLIQGNAKQALQEPNSIVLSETAARKLFGDKDPINRTLGIKHLITNNKEITVQVTGVFQNFPSNSHFRPEYLISMSSLSSSFLEGGHTLDEVINSNNLNSMFMGTYVVLKDGAPTVNLDRELHRLTDELLKTDSTAMSEGYKTAPLFRNITELHFDDVAWELEGMGNWMYVWVLSSIAILILVIATINYMNLATARANQRSLEVGLRKTFGGLRSQLAGQFLFESFLIVIIAFIVAMLTVLLLLPVFNQLSHKSFTAISLFNPIMLWILIGVVLFAGFVGGSYPAWVLSSFKPVDVLKGTFSKGKAGNLFRNALITVQFVVSILLVITTLVIVNQLSLMRDSKLNEYGDQMLCIRFNNTAPPRLYKPLKEAILEDPEILGVTTGPDLPRLEYFGNAGIQFRVPEVRAEAYEFRQIATDYNFPRVFELDILTGRYFIEETAADSSAVILNESAVRALNMTNDQVLGVGLLGPNGRALSVVGVVRDFPFRPINYPIDPLVIRVRPNGAGIVYLKLPVDKIGEKIAYIEKTWKRILPGIGLDYWFMDDQFVRMYASEVTISSLTINLAVLSLLITILGLAGFSSYTADRRAREIGIRKTLGGTMPQMVLMLLAGFLKIFLLASVIAIPVAYWMADQWLTSFVYRTPLSISLFVTSVGALALVTLLTVSFETMRAASINPVKAIKHD